jgi:hypothetical protein
MWRRWGVEILCPPPADGATLGKKPQDVGPEDAPVDGSFVGTGEPQDTSQAVVEVVSTPTVEQASDTKGGPTAVAELLTQEPSEGKPLPRILRCERKQQDHVRKVTLSLGKRTGDVPIRTLDRNLVGSSASSKRSDVTTWKLVVAGTHGSKIGAQFGSQTAFGRIAHGLTSAGWVAEPPKTCGGQRDLRRNRRALATRCCLRGSNSDSSACALKMPMAVLRSRLSTDARDR